MIIGVILGFGNIKTSKEQTYPINIIFKDAAGLIKDSQIRLGGVTVGKVTKAPELLPSGNEVMLEASIQSDVKIQATNTSISSLRPSPRMNTSLPMPPSSASRKAISAKSKTMPWAPQKKS